MEILDKLKELKAKYKEEKLVAEAKYTAVCDMINLCEEQTESVNIRSVETDLNEYSEVTVND